MARDDDRIKHSHNDALEDDESVNQSDRSSRTEKPNPPRTTTGKWTAPKFGSAGSGGAELEPGPERD